MATGTQHQPLTIERLERAMVLLAYMMELDGDVHMPAYQVLEQEMLRMQHRDTVRNRARNLIAAQTLQHRPLEIGLKAKK